jgi:O-antigen ligase
MRAFSTFDHTLHFSQALSMGFGLAAGLLFSTRSFALRLFCVATAAAAGLCNQVTYSVSGVIGTAAAAVTVVLGQRRRWLMLALPVLLFVAILVAPSALFERINHLATGRSISTVVRMVTYRAGIQSFVEHPLVGIGWSGIPELKENFITDKSLPPAPENFFLHRAVAIGAPGLFLFVALVVVFARNWRRSAGIDPSWPRLAVLAGFVAYFSQAMFFPGENYANNYFLWVLLALAEGMSREVRAEAVAD